MTPYQKAHAKISKLQALVSQPCSETMDDEQGHLSDWGIGTNIVFPQSEKDRNITVYHEGTIIFIGNSRAEVANFLFGLRKGYVMRKEMYCPCFGE